MCVLHFTKKLTKYNIPNPGDWFCASASSPHGLSVNYTHPVPALDLGRVSMREAGRQILATQPSPFRAKISLWSLTGRKSPQNQMRLECPLKWARTSSPNQSPPSVLPSPPETLSPPSRVQLPPVPAPLLGSLLLPSPPCGAYDSAQVNQC